MADPSPLYRKAPKGRNSKNHHRMRGMVVGEGGRSSGVLLYSKVRNRSILVKFNIILLQYAKGIWYHQ